MTVSLKHKFTSAKTDGADTSLVRPSNWNDEHDLTLAASKLLGRATASTGAAEEITVGTSLSLDAATQTLRRAALTGDVTASVDSNSTTIANGAVTAAKIGSGAATLAKLDTTGTSGYVLTAQGAGSAPVWAAASGGGGFTEVIETVFESSGTYTPNANGVFYEVVCIGGGASGGEANTNSSTTVRSNSGAGAGGALVTFTKAQMGNSAITVTVGSGGALNSNSTTPLAGGASSFGNYITTNGGPASNTNVGTVTVNTGTARVSRSGNTANNTNFVSGFAIRPYSGPTSAATLDAGNASGINASLPGAGGGGATATGTANVSRSTAGGAGGPGIVIVREYI